MEVLLAVTKGLRAPAALHRAPLRCRATPPEGPEGSNAPAPAAPDTADAVPDIGFDDDALEAMGLTDLASDGAGAAKVRPWRWEETTDAAVATSLLCGILAVGATPLGTSAAVNDLFYFMGLALCTIYIGAHRGLTNRARQNISLKQGALAPVFASVALFGMYLFVKFLPDLDLKTVVNAYFWLLGTLAIAGVAQGPLATLAGPLGEKSIKFDVPKGWLIDEEGEPVTKGEIAPTDLAILPLAMALATLDANANHQIYTLNNFIACCIATDVLQLIGLKSFRTAAVLFVGMLCYDVFWVFGSGGVTQTVTGNDESVMVAVATSDLITGPIKLEFPRFGAIPGDYPWSILGLGDIAIPGLLACLALRYDATRTVPMGGRARAAAEAFRDVGSTLDLNVQDSTEVATRMCDAAQDAYDKEADADDARREWNMGNVEGDGDGRNNAAFEAPIEVMLNRNYFWPVMGAYGVGLFVAFAANAITKMGQPALLYLCPLTLAAVAGTAVNRGEFDRVWKYEDKSRSVMEVAEEKRRAEEAARRAEKGEDDAGFKWPWQK
ncbi:unnamed protein product [Pedinophyceae sp. YPF-701]|nr:unnamed protein product [Pedinophyceae sp. YPF-701]